MNPATPSLPPAPTESNGFWGMSAVGKPGNRGASSFESFLPDEEPSFEEPVAPPKKKSPVVLEFATPTVNGHSPPPPTTLENPALGEASDASTAETPPATEETPSSPVQGKAKVPEDGDSATVVDESSEEPEPPPLSSETVSPPADDLEPSVAGPNDQKESADFSNDTPPRQDSSSSGTESASEEQMVSLATYEDAISQETPPTDMAGPAGDTPIVSTSKAFQVSTPTTPDPLVTAPNHVSTSPTTPASQAHQLGTSRAHVADASGVLKLLQIEAAKLSQSTRSQIQLDLTVDTGDSVRIRLNLRGNELFTAIATDSADLREALQKSWPEFLSNQKDRPYRFADSQFQDSFNDPDQRAPRRQTPFESPDENPASMTGKRRAANPVATPRSNQPVQLWA